MCKSIKIRWFTFIEILVSITILALVTFVWISSFQKFFSSSQITSIKTKLTNQISMEKNDLAVWKISSYRITFNSWAKAIFIDEDFFNNKNLISFQIDDYNSFSGKIMVNAQSNWIWLFNSYLDNISYQSEIKNSNWGLVNFDLSKNKTFQTYVINSTVDDMSTNNLKIMRLDYSGLDPKNVQETIIATISGSTSYNSASLENIMWNKRTLVSTWANQFVTNENLTINITRWAEELNFKLDK